jgi:hypothetical protein
LVKGTLEVHGAADAEVGNRTAATTTSAPASFFIAASLMLLSTPAVAQSLAAA